MTGALKTVERRPPKTVHGFQRASDLQEPSPMAVSPFWPIGARVGTIVSEAGGLR
jgi:hypothetical protein